MFSVGASTAEAAQEPWDTDPQNPLVLLPTDTAQEWAHDAQAMMQGARSWE